MSSIGPQLPAHLTKRKRSLDTPPSPSVGPKTSRPRLSNTDAHPRDDPSDASRHSHPNADEIDLDDVASPQPHSSDSDDIGPSLPNTSHTSKTHHSPDEDDSSSIGPSLPTVTYTSQDDDGSSDDDFGPSLPSTKPSRTIGPTLPPSTHSDSPRRDDWMLAPPPSSSTFSERDPTHLRARKFASRSKPPPGPADTASIWTETPEEKLRRLRDSVLGRTEEKEDRRAGEQRERDRTVADTIKASRGKSLYEEHVDRKRDEQHKGEAEDDPSKRAFDREKDMALGGRVNATQRRQLINKSANFGDRFSKGSFL